MDDEDDISFFTRKNKTSSRDSSTKRNPAVLKRREAPKASSSVSRLAQKDQEAPRKKRRVRSSSASSSSDTGYVVSTSRAARLVESPRVDSPVITSSPAIQRKLVKGKQRSSSQGRSIAGRSDHIPDSQLSDPPSADEFDLPPALRAQEPAQDNGWKPRSRPRALPSHTQLDGGSQFLQPPIVSDATMTGTDSPKSLPRSSSQDRSEELEAVGDVSLFAGLADYPFEYEAEADFFLPPPLRAAKSPSPAKVVSPVRKVSPVETVSPKRSASPSEAGPTGKEETVQQSSEAVSTSYGCRDATPAPSADAGAGASGRHSKFRPVTDESTSTANGSTSKQVGQSIEEDKQASHERVEKEAAEEPTVSKFFENTKRKRSSRARAETPVQGSAPRAKEDKFIERPAGNSVASSRKSDKKGKRRLIVQSDEEDEEEQDQIEPCPMCGQMFPLSAQFDHQAACLADHQTSEARPADGIGSSRAQTDQHASGSAPARKEHGARLQPFRPTNPPVASRTAVSAGSVKAKSNTAGRHSDSTEEVKSSSPPRAAGGSSARMSRSTQRRQSRPTIPEVIDVDDEIEGGADSDLEVVPQARPTRKEKGKERQRDESPPPGSIFISKLPAAIKQGYYRMLKRDVRGKVLLDSEDQVERPATGAKIAPSWPIAQERERKKAPAKGKTWGSGFSKRKSFTKSSRKAGGRRARK